MSDARAAAERMRAWLALPEPKGVTDRHYDGGVGQYDIDSEILVNSYLAEHPADDETPMTELWWCDMNGGSRFMYLSEERLMLYLAVDGMIELCVTDCLQEISYKLPHIKTRGDVRMLCRALGVEVKG